MISTKRDSCDKLKLSYPVLMESRDNSVFIVYDAKANKCICVSVGSSSINQLFKDHTLDHDMLKPYNGKITLENE